MKLPKGFYSSDDVLHLTKCLLGKYLFTCIDGLVTGGLITEAEAYNGITDKASHAYGGRLTKRTSTMYLQGGVAYVYLCYGIHEMFNIVTGNAGDPHAILIRAIEPVYGLEHMLLRRKAGALKPSLTSGPGSVCRALGISRALNGEDLTGKSIWLEDRGINLPEDSILSGPRVGVKYAAEDASLPYRFYIKGNKFVSKYKP
jgi:DNA-3-methyladenine glycosylase